MKNDAKAKNFIKLPVYQIINFAKALFCTVLS